MSNRVYAASTHDLALNCITLLLGSRSMTRREHKPRHLSPWQRKLARSQQLERTYAPVFTSMEHLAEAYRQQPPWTELLTLEVIGSELLTGLPLPISVAINPWTATEYLLDLS